MSRSNTTEVDRRRLLRGAGAASLGGAALVTAGPQPASAYDPGQKELASRYRESEHIKAFYRTNGYETLKK